MIILNNASLIIDDVKKAVSGTVNIKDQYIDKVYLVSSKIDECESIKVLNLDNHIIMPYFICEHPEFKLFDLNLKYIDSLDHLDTGNYVYSSYETVDEKTEEVFKNHNIIIDELFNKTANLGIDKQTLVNFAFSDNEPYVMFKIDKGIDPSVVKLVLKNIPYNRLIIKSDDMISTIKKLHFQFGVDLVDIVAFTTLNLARFLNIENQYGTITRGKYAHLLVFDAQLNLVKKIIDGIIYDL